jgi:putative oxidoreductase
VPTLTPTSKQNLLLVARLLMASLFLFSGLEKVFRFDAATHFAAAFGVPKSSLLMPVAILFELGASVALVTPRYCRTAALALALWTITLGVWFHPFWSVSGDRWQDTVDGFFHHLVMTGGLIYVAVLGAGGPLLTRSASDETGGVS